MRPQPLIAVKDVEASSRWYEQLLGARGSHGGPEYQRLTSKEGELILQLHHRDVEHYHGRIGDPSVPYGNGLLLWFEIDDFDEAMRRVAEMNPEIVMERHRNDGPEHWECWVRDPDGYTVVLASPDGSAR